MTTDKQHRPLPNVSQETMGDIRDAVEQTVHAPWRVRGRKGVRGCVIWYALTEESRVKLGRIGELCRLLRFTPGLMDKLAIDYTQVELLANEPGFGAPEPPPGCLPRTTREVTIFFSLLDPENFDSAPQGEEIHAA